MSNARNNTTKLQYIRLVEDFGAVASDTIDSGAALQAAFTWAGQGPSRQVELRGATYVSQVPLVIDRGRVTGNSTIKFVGISGSSDCLTLQGSSAQFPLHLNGISVDANNTGRDGIRVSGGNSSNHSADYLRISGVTIINAIRDGLHMEPGLAYDWIEDFRVMDVRITTPGRHGICMVVPNLTSVFINQGVFDNVEIRGAGRLTTGAVDVFCDSQGTLSDQKISEIAWLNCEFDVAGGVYHAQNCISLNKTGSASGYDGWTFLNCTAEDTGSVITGFPLVVGIYNSSNVRGFYWKGGVIADYGYIVDPSLIGWGEVDCGTSGRRMIKRSMSSIGFAASYANDAAAAVAGVPIGGEYRNGSVLQVRVS